MKDDMSDIAFVIIIDSVETPHDGQFAYGSHLGLFSSDSCEEQSKCGNTETIQEGFEGIGDENDAFYRIDRHFPASITGDTNVEWILFLRGDGVLPDDDVTPEGCVTVINVAEKTPYRKCYEHALRLVTADYVCFTQEHLYYGDDYVSGFRAARREYDNPPIIFTDYRKYDPERAQQYPEQFSFVEEDVRTASKHHIFLQSYCFQSALAQSVVFPDLCDEEIGAGYLIQALISYPSAIFVSNVFCSYKDMSRQSNNYYGCDNADYYLPSLRNYYLPLVESYHDDMPTWLQRIVYSQLYFKYYSNVNARNHFKLTDDTLNEFFHLSSQILKHIDNRLIVDNTVPEQYAPPLMLRKLFMKLKYAEGQCPRQTYSLDNGTLFYQQAGFRYSLTKHQDITVMALDVMDGVLRLDLRFFESELVEQHPDCIACELNGKRLMTEPIDIYSLDKVFGVSIRKSYSFVLKIPVADLKDSRTGLRFFLDLDGNRIALPCHFRRAPSKLSGTSLKHSYWHIHRDDYMVYDAPALRIITMTRIHKAIRERLLLRDIEEYLSGHYGEASPSVFERIKAVRKQYFTYKRSGKEQRIWLFFDKLFKAGDNGEYAFRYAIHQHDGIDCYYVINEDAPDHDRLKMEFGNHILEYGTMRCMLFALIAETVVATHPDIIQFFGYDKYTTEAVKDLFNPNLVCIAHGVTIQKNADYQNRLFDNTMLYTTSSRYEVNHILKPAYGYSPDQVRLTGMARFDGLVSQDKKQILITPTWRRNLVGKAARNSTRAYSKTFKDSSYFKIYNTLVNDERLIACAKQNGYRILFLLHPSMSTQLCDYDRNDYVDIVPASGDMSYEKVLVESSLMVTDYSGVHYDFGYMRKPVIYYQPKEVPMRFEEGGMKFSTMGFGPVVTEYEELIPLLCDYLDRQCAMPLEYRRRADDFFAFDDHSNCKRIYEAILDWTNNREARKNIQ